MLLTHGKADTGTSTDQLEGAPSQLVGKWREMWVLKERYLDVMVFLFVIFAIVLLNCIYVC